jgi:hypothetical protein
MLFSTTLYLNDKQIQIGFGNIFVIGKVSKSEVVYYKLSAMQFFCCKCFLGCYCGVRQVRLNSIVNNMVN